jgi:Transposase IS66 family
MAKGKSMRWFEAQWLALLDRGERLNPRQEPGESFAAKRGKHKQSTQFNLLVRLRQYKDDVWRFATEVGAPFTNNLAEQALRMSKVRQKVSGCFRTDEGAKTFLPCARIYRPCASSTSTCWTVWSASLTPTPSSLTLRFELGLGVSSYDLSTKQAVCAMYISIRSYFFNSKPH